MFQVIKDLIIDEEGATMVEYAMLLALIVAALIAIWSLLGDTISCRVCGVIKELDASADCTPCGQ